MSLFWRSLDFDLFSGRQRSIWPFWQQEKKIKDIGKATPTVERQPMISDLILAKNLQAKNNQVLYLVQMLFGNLKQWYV